MKRKKHNNKKIVKEEENRVEQGRENGPNGPNPASKWEKSYKKQKIKQFYGIEAGFGPYGPSTNF